MPTRIDWCDETINPLGHWCFGPSGTEANPKPCPYCYAKKLAARGMRGCPQCQRFEKHTHFEQLDKLACWKNPRTIFVQSMGDLFHDEVPDVWISQVFDACERAPQHRYLFLTKNPDRYRQLYENKALPFRENFWFGTSVPTPDTQYAWFANTPFHGFVSIEPIMEPFGPLQAGQMPEWAIIGAETGNRKGKPIPERWWIEQLAEELHRHHVPVFMKESLRPLMGEQFVQEFPWDGYIMKGENTRRCVGLE